MKTRVYEEGRVCTKCLQYKEWKHFGADFRRNTGHKSCCLDCERKGSRTRKAVAGIRGSGGLTQLEFELKFKKQKGICPICGILMLETGLSEISAVSDHCHKTGKPRDLICNACNRMLGGAKDNPVVLNKGILYLEQHHDSP